MTAAKTAKILVLDDEPAHLLITVRGLRKLGAPLELLQAASRSEALRLVQAHRDIDLFVIDINLDGDSGLAVLACAREQPHCAHTPAIIVSTSKLEDDVQRSYAGGAAVFLQKSADAALYQSELARAAASLLGR